jgi:glucose-6-phosphate isomerase
MKISFADALVHDTDLSKYKDGLQKGTQRLQSGMEDLTGWVKVPFNYDRDEMARLMETAEKIQKQCDIFIIIGIGGSYLGARAAIEMLCSSSDKKSAAPEILFAGFNLSGTYHAELLEHIENKEICVCVVSKSGTTTEPNIAFSILKDVLYKKYGKEGASSRIYAVTDSSRGVLREEANREGYTTFVVPDDIGGRYSVLTPVGLLPIAVAGIDIYEILDGAQQKATVDSEDGVYKKASGMDAAEALAAVRSALNLNGKMIEVYEYYEPRLQFFAEWLKQLFGESEGKEGKGIFPAALQFTADLHSMGQYLQEGKQVFFETILNVVDPGKDMIVPKSAGELLAGKSMNAVNQAALEGVMSAHRAADIPMIRIDIPALTPFHFGQMVYFFETVCALSCYLAGVYPFNQPGVESYKEEMRKVLKRDNNKQ